MNIGVLFLVFGLLSGLISVLAAGEGGKKEIDSNNYHFSGVINIRDL